MLIKSSVLCGVGGSVTKRCMLECLRPHDRGAANDREDDDGRIASGQKYDLFTQNHRRRGRAA